MAIPSTIQAMTNLREFWLVQNAALLAFYGLAGILLGTGQSGHWSVTLAGIVLLVHVLEVPLAFAQLKAREPKALRVIVGTLIFGFTWWLPAKKGLYKVA